MTASSKDATTGLRTALSQGIDKAVTQLGATNGFLNDPKVAIPLPPTLQKAERAMRLVGMGQDADNLKVAMNHAAESAVAAATPVFKDALQRMTLADAKGILSGGDDAGTQYFRRTTTEQLTSKFKPIVARETAETGRLHRCCDRVRRQGRELRAGQRAGREPERLRHGRSALDGLFSRIADEEKAIRRILGTGQLDLRKVFGAAARTVRTGKPSIAGRLRGGFQAPSTLLAALPAPGIPAFPFEEDYDRHEDHLHADG